MLHKFFKRRFITPEQDSMTRHLDHLLLQIDKRDQVALKQAAHTEFIGRYANNQRSYLLMHDHQRCDFSPHQVNHAFRETIIVDGRQKKGGWSSSRIKRIPWISEVIQGNAPHIACFNIDAGAEKGWDKERRLYIFHRYVVWLHRLDLNFEFSTAYLVDDLRDLRQYGRFGKKLI